MQRRAARFVTGDYGFMSSVTGMLSSLGWTSLECRREISRVIMLFKILHNETSISSYHLPMPITTCTRGHSYRFRQISAHLNIYLHSFFPATIKIWNSLPATAIEATNVDDFQKRIVDYFVLTQLYSLKCCTFCFLACICALYSLMEVCTVLIINK